MWTPLPALDLLPLCLTTNGQVEPGRHKPAALFPGSFNPLHQGHRALHAIARQLLQVEVAFEISVSNVDKPELTHEDVERRALQFHGLADIWLTRAPTFEEKAELFPGCAFVLGQDTAERLIDPRYYGNDSQRRDAAIQKMQRLGCKFVVAGRKAQDGQFRTWNSGILGAEFESLFRVLDESQFRVDCASRDLRHSS